MRMRMHCALDAEALMRARPIVAVSADRVLRGAHPNHTAGEKYLVAVVDGAGALAFVLRRWARGSRSTRSSRRSTGCC